MRKIVKRSVRRRVKPFLPGPAGERAALTRPGTGREQAGHESRPLRLDQFPFFLRRRENFLPPPRACGAPLPQGGSSATSLLQPIGRDDCHRPSSPGSRLRARAPALRRVATISAADLPAAGGSATLPPGSPGSPSPRAEPSMVRPAAPPSPPAARSYIGPHRQLAPFRALARPGAGSFLRGGVARWGRRTPTRAPVLAPHRFQASGSGSSGRRRSPWPGWSSPLPVRKSRRPAAPSRRSWCAPRPDRARAHGSSRPGPARPRYRGSPS